MPDEPAGVDPGLVQREFVSVYDEQFDRPVRVAYLTTGSGPSAENLVHVALTPRARDLERDVRAAHRPRHHRVARRWTRLAPIRLGQERCRRRTAMMFPELVVGFSDHGDGPVLTSWAANINGRPIDPAGLPPPLATAEGLSVGDMTADAETIYGSAFHQDRWTPTLWSPYLKPVGKVDSADGTVVLINLQDDDHLDMLTAGIGCDLVPMQLAPTGPTTGDSPIGLHFMTILIGEEDPSTPQSDQQWVIIDTSTGQQTRWHYLGGRCDPGSLCVTFVSPSDSGQPVMLWATYEVERNPAGTTVWEVTDTFEVPVGTRVFGSWECGAGVPLSTADDTVVTALLSVDPATGAFVTLPVNDESCVRTH